MKDRAIAVTDAAFPYLVLQQGALDHLKGDRIVWEDAYRARLAELFAQIAPHLPKTCARILDVGGGMGGIDILLHRHFGAEISIVDGLDDPPVMVRHDKTFNSLVVAAQFLEANGVRDFRLRPPIAFRTDPLGSGKVADLVVSFASWCFHYPPAEYLEAVKAACHADTILILDVREGRADWLQQLLGVFDPVAATVYPKFTRWILKPRAA